MISELPRSYEACSVLGCRVIESLAGVCRSKHREQGSLARSAGMNRLQHHKLQIDVCCQLEAVWHSRPVDEAVLEATLKVCTAAAAAHTFHLDARHSGLTLLHWAVLAGRESTIDALSSTVTQLVSWNARITNPKLSGATPLCLAALLDADAAVYSLLGAGASPTVAWEQPDLEKESTALAGLSPLHVVRYALAQHIIQ